MKESLRKRGMNYEALVRGKLDTALAFGQKLTLGAAEAEVIADASEQMLQDTTFIRSAPQGLKNRIKSVIKDFAKKVRAVFATLSGGHKESTALRELKNNMYHYVDDLQSKWDIAAVEMVNRQAEQGTQEAQQNAQEGQQNAQEAVPVEELKPVKQFAMKSTVEKRDDGLIAVHNLSEENLLTMLTELEGIPAPSFAIVKAKQGHTEFAEISVIVDSSSIDPQANSDNRVYGNDAWTQRVPRAAYEVNIDVVQEQRTHAEEILAPFSKSLAASAGSFYNDVENNQATRDPKKTLMARARANVGLMAEYLLEHGKTFDYKPNGGSRNNIEIFEKVKPDKEIYLEWVQEKLNRMLGKKTIAGTGADFTAENAVQLMRQGKESNGQTEYIAKNMQFNAAKRYRSLDEIRADAERLRMLPDEERNEFIFQMEDELEGILDALARKGAKSTLPLLSEAPDTRTIFKAQEILERAGREELSAQETAELFEQNGFESVNTDDVERGLDLVKRIQEYPTGYFEAKPMRVVGFDEIAQIIAPDDISGELETALQERGIPYTTYETGNNTDRIAKMNAVEGVKFALRDTEYMNAVEAGDMDTAQRMVDEAAEQAFSKSKIRGTDGKLLKVYHGTNAEFTVFDTSKQGGVNGTAEGYGIYLSDTQEVTSAYGKRQIAAYANIMNPATSWKKTITQAKLAKLIRASCMQEAQRMVDDGEYDNVRDAMRDTWISNYTDTYSTTIDTAIRDTARSILDANDDDMSIVQEVMAGMAIRDYQSAEQFYKEVLTPTTGIDGFWTRWGNREGGAESNIILAMNSNQIKDASPVTYDDAGKVIPLSERFNASEKDIRYALREYGLKTIPAEDQENILARGNFVIESREDLLQRISEALTDSSIKAALFVGNVDKATRNQLERETGITLFRDLDYAFGISADCIRHIAKHFSNAAEIADTVEMIFSMLKDHDSVTPQKRSDGGMNLILKKNAAEIELEAPTWVSRRTRSVTVKTAYITKNNKKRANPHQASIVNNRDSLGRVEQLNNSVLQTAESVNSERQFALRDDVVVQ